MGIQIEDGTGSGTGAKVDSENRILTSSVSETLEHHANQHEGEAYNVLFSVTPAGAGDDFFYLKNNDDKDSVIEGIWWQTDGTETVTYVLSDIGNTGGTVGNITPANLNAGSGKVANAIVQSGNDITGLSGGTNIQTIKLTTQTTSAYFNCEQDIIISKNQTFTITATSGSVALIGTVVFNFHS